MEATEKFCELLLVGKSHSRARTLELFAAVEAFQAGEELAAKDTTQDFDG